ncbi:hypothetical protein [Dactylosporangium sp. NPDC051541]|uniref:hypothetical protein n=1 Tax=Dactylosporangium sp. NPDC051541 TaxID=3363977 RepID=UPI00379ECA38
MEDDAGGVVDMAKGKASMLNDFDRRRDGADGVFGQIRSVRGREALRRWSDQVSANLLPSGWVGAGFTDAQLLGVYVEGYGEHLRGVILKITDREDSDREYILHNRALHDAPRLFAEAHLTRLIGSPISIPDGGSIVMQSIAGGGFDELVEVDRLPPHLVKDACRRLVGELLTEWNTRSTSKKVDMGIVLEELLGERLAAGGSIDAWAGRHPGLLTDSRPWLSRGGECLVNPFALVGREPALRLMPVILTYGLSHRDLHPGNVLFDRRGERYFLVDLSRYTASGLLAWDSTYLALTTVAKYLDRVDFRDRDALLQWMLSPTDQLSVTVPPELSQPVAGIHEAATEYARNQGQWSAWRPQHLLCIVAIALMITGRGRLLAPDLRTWFFWLAARAATELLPRDTKPADDPLGLPDPLILGELIGLDAHRPAAAAEPEPDERVGNAVPEWGRFVCRLRAARLDALDRATLAIRVEPLRAELANLRDRAAAHENATIGRCVDELATVLDAALRPGTTSAEIQAATAHADLLRAWLLDLLS